jgi:hypothetical protein
MRRPSQTVMQVVPNDELLALFRPDRAFNKWWPSFRLVAAVVVLLAIVNGAGISAGAGEIGAAVSGSVAVDNPADPHAHTCEIYGEGGMFNDSERAATVVENCRTEPPTIQQPLSPVAERAAGGMAFTAGLGTLVWWVLCAGVFALFTTQDSRGFRELLAIAGIGLLPSVIRYVARPFFVARATSTWSHPGSIDALQAAARAFVTGSGVELFSVVVVATLLWQAMIHMYALSSIEDVSSQRAGAIAFGLALVPALLFLSGIQLPPAEMSGISLLLLLFGLPSVACPYTLTKLGEQLDAIGSTRRMSEVEPAGWNVWLTRAGGIVILAIAFWLLGGPLIV